MNFRALYQSSIIAAVVVFCGLAHTYEPLTHSAISKAGGRSSSIFDGKKLSRMALPDFDDRDINSSTTSYPEGERTDQTILNLIIFGSTWEDDRSLLNGTRHFFTPLNAHGMTTPSIVLISSPEWILGDREKPGHEFKW